MKALLRQKELTELHFFFMIENINYLNITIVHVFRKISTRK